MRINLNKKFTALDETQEKYFLLTAKGDQPAAFVRDDDISFPQRGSIRIVIERVLFIASKNMDNEQQVMAHFEATCRAHGLKLTHQRLEIYRMLLQSAEHPSAESLHKQLESRLSTLSLDTVYRTLATFEELGLVKRVETMASQARFEAVIDQHHHFFCDQCGRLIDFHWHLFDTMGLPESLQGIGKIKDKNVVVHGVCEQCLIGHKSEG